MALERREVMERELTLPRPIGSGGGAPACGEGIEQTRAALDDILAEADRILDNLKPVNAEEYLQQNRQRGGE
jgi:hypothetical protein